MAVVLCQGDNRLFTLLQRNRMLLAVGSFISYNIKLLKAVVVSPHKGEASQPLLYVCCVYEFIYNGATIASLY